MVINFRKVTSRVEFRSIFRAPSRKFKILANPNVIAHGKSYKHGFTKNSTRRVSIVEFRSVFLAPSQKFKILAIPDVIAHGKSYVHVLANKLDGHILCANRSCAESSFKIMPIPDVLAHGKSYEHGLVKKRDGHKHCAKSHAESGFDQFFVHHLKNSKYWPFPT
ncbi:hypothetical protein BHM03_00060413 [Ensete ventricosum]|nr:hypothetical protein BHM03_00060413 [Ensete ventricosum]